MHTSDISSRRNMRYCFDIDGTICVTPLNSNGKPDYHSSTPIPFMLAQVNKLYAEGNYIIMQTARGKSSGIDWTELTTNQLESWGFKYHELFKMFCKPNADIFIDDKGVNSQLWCQSLPKVRGIVAGAFDLIHPGYIRMFKQAKLHCNHLTVALHVNPQLERSFKLPPIQTVEERLEILNSITYIDNVVIYERENKFLSLLNDYDIRFLGSDYMDG